MGFNNTELYCLIAVRDLTGIQCRPLGTEVFWCSVERSFYREWGALVHPACGPGVDSYRRFLVEGTMGYGSLFSLFSK